MRLEPIQLFSRKNAVLEHAFIEVGVESLVEQRQHAAMKWSVDAVLVLEKPLELEKALAKIDADDQAVAGTHAGAQVAQQSNGADRGRGAKCVGEAKEHTTVIVRLRAFRGRERGEHGRQQRPLNCVTPGKDLADPGA